MCRGSSSAAPASRWASPASSSPPRSSNGWRRTSPRSPTSASWRGGPTGPAAGGPARPRGADPVPSGARRGAEGETAAAALLEAKGFRIVAKTHRTRLGEVDLVADDGEVLAFVEVRTRSSALFGGPLESV